MTLVEKKICPYFCQGRGKGVSRGESESRKVPRPANKFNKYNSIHWPHTTHKPDCCVDCSH